MRSRIMISLRHRSFWPAPRPVLLCLRLRQQDLAFHGRLTFSFRKQRLFLDSRFAFGLRRQGGPDFGAFAFAKEGAGLLLALGFADGAFALRFRLEHSDGFCRFGLDDRSLAVGFGHLHDGGVEFLLLAGASFVCTTICASFSAASRSACFTFKVFSCSAV